MKEYEGVKEKERAKKKEKVKERKKKSMKDRHCKFAGESNPQRKPADTRQLASRNFMFFSHFIHKSQMRYI